MRFDFSRVEDVESYVSVPEGTYRCRIAEVREGRARDGSPRWSLRLEVAAGDYAGRTAAWDALTWSERGVYRVKRVLEALALDVSGELEVVPADLVGLEARVQVLIEEREDPLSGRRQLRLRVPYDGFAPLEEGVAESARPSAPGAMGDGRESQGANGRARPVDARGGEGE
jgi:hypothetical protein